MIRNKLVAILIATLVFPWLFYENMIGINLFLYNLLVFGGLLFINKLKFSSIPVFIIVIGTALSSILVVLINSGFVIAVNIISLFLLAGITLYPKARDMVVVGITSFINFFYGQINFLNLLNEVTSKSKASRSVLRFFQIVIVPLIVVIVFFIIYKTANPVFEGYVRIIIEFLNNMYSYLIKYIEISLILVAILGLIFSNYFFLGKPVKDFTDATDKLSFDLKLNVKSEISELSNDTEYRSAIVLFSLLNILICVVNIIDIDWFWFGFEWDGDYLKQFVHEGTYLLLFSILISLIISIFYFRGKLNFISKSKPLRILAYIWLFQNAILSISVGIRNFWYIQYFSLAYLRIGVIFFLLLTLFSIFSVVIKIRNKKSTYFLFSINSIALYVVLIIMSLFNWDVIIAKYNFSHTNTSFLHYNFMAGLNNSALPYLIKSKQELEKINLEQDKVFSFDIKYMSSEEYYKNILDRENTFLQDFPRLNWQEWNLAEEIAYRKLQNRLKTSKNN